MSSKTKIPTENERNKLDHDWLMKTRLDRICDALSSFPWEQRGKNKWQENVMHSFMRKTRKTTHYYDLDGYLTRKSVCFVVPHSSRTIFWFDKCYHLSRVHMWHVSKDDGPATTLNTMAIVYNDVWETHTSDNNWSPQCDKRKLYVFPLILLDNSTPLITANFFSEHVTCHFILTSFSTLFF